MIPESQSNELENQGTESSKEISSEESSQSKETQGAGESSTDENSADSFDKSKLPSEVQAYLDKREKEMTSDYTRKTQLLAEDKRAVEENKRQFEEMKLEYERARLQLQNPDKEDDFSQATAEQKQAVELLDKRYEKKFSKLLEEKEKIYQGQIKSLQGQVGDMAWRSFVRENPDASKYRGRMRELYQEKGGVNCPLNLDELLTLAQKDDLKKLGVEEYKRSVQTKKTNATTKPSSTVGGEAGIQFDNTPGTNPGKFFSNFMKAAEKASDDISSGRVK